MDPPPSSTGRDLVPQRRRGVIAAGGTRTEAAMALRAVLRVSGGSDARDSEVASEQERDQPPPMTLAQRDMVDRQEAWNQERSALLEKLRAAADLMPGEYRHPWQSSVAWKHTPALVGGLSFDDRMDAAVAEARAKEAGDNEGDRLLAEGEPFPSQLLDAEDRGSSSSEEDNMFVKVGPVIDPLSDAEYRELQRRAALKGETLPDREYEVAWWKPDGRVATDKGRDLDELVARRVRERKEWERRGLGRKRKGALWEVDMEEEAERLLETEPGVVLGLDPERGIAEKMRELGIGEEGEAQAHVDVDDEPEICTAFGKVDWEGMRRAVGGKGRKTVRENRAARVVDRHLMFEGRNLTIYNRPDLEPVCEVTEEENSEEPIEIGEELDMNLEAARVRVPPCPCITPCTSEPRTLKPAPQTPNPLPNLTRNRKPSSPNPTSRV